MKRLIIAAALAIPFAAYPADAAFKDCSTKASKMTKKADLAGMAKVKEADAKKTALGTAGKGATIVKGGIETEDGCLVYSYHVKDPAVKGQSEVFVDAGSGKVLKVEKEGTVREGAEKVVDKTKEVAVKTKDKVKEEAKEVKEKVSK
jgi:uncharacterized membrane protein YkoI